MLGKGQYRIRCIENEQEPGPVKWRIWHRRWTLRHWLPAVRNPQHAATGALRCPALDWGHFDRMGAIHGGDGIGLNLARVVRCALTVGRGGSGFHSRCDSVFQLLVSERLSRSRSQYSFAHTAGRLDHRRSAFGGVFWVGWGLRGGGRGMAFYHGGPAIRCYLFFCVLFPY